MKKAVVFAVIFLAAVSLNAQSFGVKAGLNLANWVGSDAGDTKAIAGFHIGGLAEFPISSDLYLQPELLLTQMGTKSAGITYRPLYIQVPINLMLKVALGTGKLTIGAGPYAALGIGGKASANGESMELFTKVDGEDAMLKRFDAGIGINVGYEMNNGFFLDLGTSYGLTNIPNTSDVSVKNSLVTVSAGFKFKSK